MYIRKRPTDRPTPPRLLRLPCSKKTSFLSRIQLLEKRNQLHNQDKIMARPATINWMCWKIKCKFTDSISDIDVAEAKLPLIPHFVHVPHAANPKTAGHCTFVLTSKSELTFSFSNKKQPIFSTAKSVHLILTPIRSFFYWPLNGNQLNSWHFRLGQTKTLFKWYSIFPQTVMHRK